MPRLNNLPPVCGKLGKLVVCVLVMGFGFDYGSANAQTRYSYSDDGSEVADAKTGLVWQRCVAGMTWSAGACHGSAATFTHEQALAYAKTNVGWRLPNIKELASIVDITRGVPAVDIAVFPNTPSNIHWTSSPVAGDTSRAWQVEFNNGNVQAVYSRAGAFHLRLVR